MVLLCSVCSSVLWPLIISDPVYETPPKSNERAARVRSTSFSGFSPTRPYGARERETLVGSGHVVPEQS